MKWDAFCFSCHKLRTDINCSSCCRSYHVSCANAQQLTAHEKNKWHCNECVEVEVAEEDAIDW